MIFMWCKSPAPQAFSLHKLCSYTKRPCAKRAENMACSKFEPASGAIMQWASCYIWWQKHVHVWDLWWSQEFQYGMWYDFELENFNSFTHCLSLWYVLLAKEVNFGWFIQNMITNLSANVNLELMLKKGRQISDNISSMSMQCCPLHICLIVTLWSWTFKLINIKAKMNYSNPNNQTK